MTSHSDVELQAELAKSPGAPATMSVAKTIKYIDIGKTKLYELFDISGGPIRTCLLGKRRLVFVASADEYLESREAKRKRRIIESPRNRRTHKP